MFTPEHSNTTMASTVRSFSRLVQVGFGTFQGPGLEPFFGLASHCSGVRINTALRAHRVCSMQYAPMIANKIPYGDTHGRRALPGTCSGGYRRAHPHSENRCCVGSSTDGCKKSDGSVPVQSRCIEISKHILGVLRSIFESFYQQKFQTNFGSANLVLLLHKGPHSF